MVLLINVPYLIQKALSLFMDINVRYKPYGYTSLCVAVVWVAAVLYGHYIGRFRHEVTQWTYVNGQIPAAFDGYRIVHISDIHSGGWVGNEERLQTIVDEVNALQPDLICFTGDIADLHPSEVYPVIPVLKQLVAKDGVVSILGNHDYFPYGRFGESMNRRKAIDEVIGIERDTLGWQLLLNENVIINRGGDSIAVLGSENQSMGTHSVVRRGNLQQAMDGTDGMFRILLTHDPTHWRGEVVGNTDIPLTLSGHTHAMQFRIFGWSPSCFAYSEYDGKYSEGAQTLYVNIGLGGSIRMRVGATPEITLLTLRRQ